MDQCYVGRSFSPPAAGPAAAFSPTRLGIQLGIAGPRGRHGGGRGIGAVLDQAKIFLIRYGLPQLAQDVIVYISCVPAALKEIASMRITKGPILAWK